MLRLRFRHYCFSLLLVTAVAGAQLPAAKANIKILRNVTYATVAGKPLRADLFLPQGSSPDMPLVLMIHGPSWSMGDRQSMRPLAEAFAGQGIAVMNVDYRLAPDARFPAQIDDTRAAARWASAHAAMYHYNRKRIYALGTLAGGHLAAMLGLWPDGKAPQLAGVIAIGAPTDLTTPTGDLRVIIALRQFLGSRAHDAMSLAMASPIKHVRAGSPPFMIVQARKDGLIPYSQATKFADALQSLHVRVKLYALAGDQSLPDLDSPLGGKVFRAIVAFMGQKTT